MIYPQRRFVFVLIGLLISAILANSHGIEGSLDAITEDSAGEALEPTTNESTPSVENRADTDGHETMKLTDEETPPLTADPPSKQAPRTDGNVPDFMRKETTVPSSSMIIADHLQTARDLEKEVARIDTLTPDQQVDLVESIKNSMVDMDAMIDGVDLSDPKLEEVKSLTDVGRDYTYKAIQAVEDAVSFMRSMSAAETASEEQDKLKAYTRGEFARRLEFGADAEEDMPFEEDDNSWRGHAGYKQRNEGKHWQQRRRTKERFSGANHRGDTFHRRANSHHQRKLNDFMDAMYNGNIHTAFSHFATGHQTGARQQSKDRRLEANKARRLSKSEQCDLLSDCVIGMSLYDMFVYYYSDDIDPATGEVDENLVKFDEEDIAEKAKLSKRIAWKIRKHGTKNDDCNILLSLFHRTIEKGEISSWEGASVNQVCLAEGSTAFVQYSAMANTLVDHSFVNGYNKVSETNWIDDVDAKLRLVAEEIAVEPLRCAEELFYKGDRKGKEEFPFGGCGGKDTGKCKIQKYKFPVQLDVATEQKKTQRYETLRTRVKCPTGYEIETKEECVIAGLSKGGVLRDGKLKTGDWDHVPCGCSIYPGDKAIHWDHGSRCKNDDWKFSVVCEEKKDKDDYEIVQHQSICDRNLRVRSKQECEDAGQQLGGWLKKGRLTVGNWKHTPCGCYLNMNGQVVFNENTANCRNDKYRWQPVCKRKKDRDFVVIRKRTQCDPGFQIKSKEKCREALEASKRVNRFFRENGGLKIDQWDNKPCGCSIYHWSGEFHWNYGDKCKKRPRNDDWNYDVVCEPNPNKNKYKRRQFKKCEAGEHITSEEECTIAGLAMNGELLDDQRVDVTTSSKVPCGCFVDRRGKIFFGKAGESHRCGDNRGYAYEHICYSEEDISVDRDVHGKLLSSEKSGFITMSYEKVWRTAEGCINSKLANLRKDCLEESEDQQNSDYFQCRVIKRKEALKDCDWMEPLQTGLELVFGTQTSPGFICGVQEAVVNDGVAMPGTCCLDAPYELDGDSWGQPYDCSKKCNNPGPYLAGINKEACEDAHGGTWCPSKANCATLQSCIKTLAEKAKDEGKLAFEQYLLGAPKIEDPHDRHQCGRSRGYFGFDELFINDQQICEDVEQLKFAKDFDFLNTFFQQGSDLATAGKGDAPELELTPPDRSRSNKPAVQGHDAWKATVYSLRVAKDTMKFIVKRLNDLKCPCDPLCISENVCNAVKNAVISIFSIILQLAILIFQVTENLFSVMSLRLAVVKAQEDAAVVFENMQLMADYLVDMRTEIREHRELREAERSVPVPDPDINDTIPKAAAAFKVKLRVIQGSKSVFALTTLDGARVDAEFSFSMLSGREEVSVDFNVTALEEGKIIIDFGEEFDGQFLLMKASPVNGSQEANDIVSFD